jgi:hypothetical protein
MEMLLKERELLDLGETLQGVKIVCQQGQCWITQSGDSRDHILSSGGSFTIRAKGQVIVTAAESCRIMLVESNKKANLQTHFREAYNKFIHCPITQKNV